MILRYVGCFAPVLLLQFMVKQEIIMKGQGIKDMCTVFSGLEKDCKILAKNYDCFVNSGMIFTNKRGMKKRSLVMPNQKEYNWISLYGSVTFSQSGKGMPSNGINEKGLIVEQATLPETVYPMADDRPEVSCLEAIQILLDTCSTVKEAIAALQNFRISNQSGKVHYFLKDSAKDMAIVEFLQGEMQLITGDEIFPAITNSTYAGAKQPKTQDASDYEKDSLRRYSIVREELLKCKKMTVDHAFEILQKARREDTVWSTVYDLSANKLYFRAGNKSIQTIDLNEIDFETTSLLFPMEADAFLWEPYSRKRNLENIKAFYGNPMVLKIMNLPEADFVINAFDTHIQRIEDESNEKH